MGLRKVLAACIVLVLLAGCGLLLINTPVLSLSCTSRFAGDPFSGPTYYVTYRLDGDLNRSQTYLVEVGQSRPLVQGGFTSVAIVALRIPLVHPRHC